MALLLCEIPKKKINFSKKSFILAQNLRHFHSTWDQEGSAERGRGSKPITECFFLPRWAFIVSYFSLETSSQRPFKRCNLLIQASLSLIRFTIKVHHHNWSNKVFFFFLTLVISFLGNSKVSCTFSTLILH